VFPLAMALVDAVAKPASASTSTAPPPTDPTAKAAARGRTLPDKIPLELLTVTSTSAIAWSRSRRYRELSTSYARAAHKLALVDGSAFLDEKRFKKVFRAAEETIAQERMSWRGAP
jgi:hypothetical protein